MGEIAATAQIPAPPERVWDVITTLSTYDQWLTIHTRWKDDVPERYSQGASAAEVVTMLGMPNTITWTVEEFEEPSRFAISGTGMAGVKVRFDFAVESDGNLGSTGVHLVGCDRGQDVVMVAERLYSGLAQGWARMGFF